MVSQNSTDNTVQDNDFSVNRSVAGTTVQSSTNHTDNTSASSDAKFLVKTGGSSGGDPHINFNVASGQNWSMGIANSDSDKMKITSGANLSSGFTYMVFPATTSNILVNGISFDGGSNAMTNYEEGNWTPSLTFGGGTAGLTSTQIGKYTRIGILVVCMFEVTLTNKGSATGVAVLEGLPFTVGSSTGLVTGGLKPTNLDFTTGFTSFYADPDTSGTTAAFQQAGEATDPVFLSDTNFNNNSAIGGLIIYSA